MDPEVMLNLMVELAGLEEELVGVRATLEHHSRRDRHLRELQVEYESDAARARSRGRDTAVTLRGAEARIRDIETNLARKRDQVAGISDDRQFEALQTEIKALEMELDRLETETIELMDEAGRDDLDSGQAESESAAQADRGEAELVRMGEETRRAAAAEEEIVGEIERLTGLLPDQVARHVIRLRNQYPQAVVRVRDGACGGCFSLFPAQQGLNAAQGRSLVKCPSCARYVVHESWR